MKTAIQELDALQSEIVMALHQSVPLLLWKSARMFAKYAPDGEVGGLDFDFCLDDGTVNRESIPGASHRARLYSLTKGHWRLTQDLGQPRWYKMIVTVEHNGKYSVDFEYKDDYEEGDIMKRG